MCSLKTISATVVTAVLALTLLHAQSKEETSSLKVETAKTEMPKPEQFKPEQQQTKGSVTIGGKAIEYDAYAGTLVVHPKGWDDVPRKCRSDPKNKSPEASMFYVAYFKSDNKGAARPVTFFYNGGPRVLHRVASHGRFRTKARRHSRMTRTPPPLPTTS